MGKEALTACALGHEQEQFVHFKKRGVTYELMSANVSTFTPWSAKITCGNLALCQGQADLNSSYCKVITEKQK